MAKKESKKQRLRREEGKDKAVERSAMLAERVKDREEKKVSEQRACSDDALARERGREWR